MPGEDQAEGPCKNGVWAGEATVVRGGLGAGSRLECEAGEADNKGFVR